MQNQHKANSQVVDRMWFCMHVSEQYVPHAEDYVKY